MNRSLTAAVLSVLLMMPAARLAAHESVESDVIEGRERFRDEQGSYSGLGLTQAQAAKLKAVRISQQASLKTLGDKRRDLMQKLEAQVKKGADDNELEGTLSELQNNHNAMIDKWDQFRSQKQDILRPMQRAKYLLKRRNGKRRA